MDSRAGSRHTSFHGTERTPHLGPGDLPTG